MTEKRSGVGQYLESYASKTRAQALDLSKTKENAVFFPTDSTSIIFGGKEYSGISGGEDDTISVDVLQNNVVTFPSTHRLYSFELYAQIEEGAGVNYPAQTECLVEQLISDNEPLNGKYLYSKGAIFIGYPGTVIAGEFQIDYEFIKENEFQYQSFEWIDEFWDMRNGSVFSNQPYPLRIIANFKKIRKI